MTPDGISNADWDMVHDLALAIVNSTDPAEEMTHRSQLLEYLRELRRKYGDLPTLLATEADYVEDRDASERLLLRAYESAAANNDEKNRTWVALSLADFYATECGDRRRASHWLDVARTCLNGPESPDWEEYLRVEDALRRLHD